MRRKFTRRMETLILIPFLLSAAGSPSALELEAEAVIEKYLQAVGGKENLAAIRSRVIKGVLLIPQMGVRARLELYVQPPGQALIRVGSASNGVHGDIAWSIDPVLGPRTLKGAERLALIRQAELEPFLDWRSYFLTVSRAGEIEIDGRSCTELVLTPPQGESVSWCFDQESGLPVRVIGLHEGKKTTTEFSNYKAVDGILIPFRTKVSTAQSSYQIEVRSVSHNVQIPEEIFRLPPEIKNLLNR